MMRACLLFVGLAPLVACSDYRLSPSEEPIHPPAGDGPVAEDETCNGRDDDLDGLIDEGFPDHDGDGIAECECAPEAAPVADVDADPDCPPPSLPPDVNPWRMQVEWRWTGIEDAPSPSWYADVTPLVGQLTDDDGDGDVDSDDAPDIVIAGTQGYGYHHVVAIDGQTGETHWVFPVTSPTQGALGDVTGDGRPDVVVRLSPTEVGVLDGAGALVWSTVLDGQAWGTPSLGDLDGDGTVEIVFDGWILDGPTGKLVGTVGGVGRNWLADPALADLDLDGEMEIVIKNHVYGADGAHRWSASELLEDTGGWGAWPAVVQADDDPEGEVLFVANGYLGVYDHDGHELHFSSVGKSHSYPPSVADFDGDGEVEVAFVSQELFMSAADSELAVFELDGTPKWSTPINAWSGFAATAAFDFDLDGAMDPVYATESTLYVVNGRNGEVMGSWFGRQAGTKSEYAVVADVDADGSSEILYASGSYAGTGMMGTEEGLTVIGHPDDAWAPGTQTWNQSAFAMGAVHGGGIVAGEHTPPWQRYNLYRAAPAFPGVSFPDLRVEVTDVCFEGCGADDTVRVAIQVANEGYGDSGAPVPVTVYSVQGEELAPVWSDVVDAVAAQTAAAGFIVELAVRDVGDNGLLVRVNDAGDGSAPLTECHLDDNEATWLGTPCQGD